MSFSDFFMIKIGRFRVDALETGRFALDGGAMFGVVPKNLWSKAYHSGDEQNRIPMAARTLLVRWDNNCVLVDCGNGSKFNEKQKSIYALDNSLSSLESSLSQFDLRSEDITDVILTHLHFDHAGGATQFRDGEIVPSFPNARYCVQKEHYDWAMNPTDKDRASFWLENFQPIIDNSQMNFLEGDQTVFEGVHVECFHGHTRALQMVIISDEGSTLVFPADLIPTHSHVPIPYVMGYDNFPLTTIEEKKSLLPRAVEEQWTVVFEHDAFMRAGRIGRSDRGFYVQSEVEL